MEPIFIQNKYKKIRYTILINAWYIDKSFLRKVHFLKKVISVATIFLDKYEMQYKCNFFNM